MVALLTSRGERHGHSRATSLTVTVYNYTNFGCIKGSIPCDRVGTWRGLHPEQQADAPALPGRIPMREIL